MSDHRYRLDFPLGLPEYVTAPHASAAVAQRLTNLLPHTITDLTVLTEWSTARVRERLTELQHDTLDFTVPRG